MLAYILEGLCFPIALAGTGSVCLSFVRQVGSTRQVGACNLALCGMPMAMPEGQANDKSSSRVLYMHGPHPYTYDICPVAGVWRLLGVAHAWMHGMGGSSMVICWCCRLMRASCGMSLMSLMSHDAQATHAQGGTLVSRGQGRRMLVGVHLPPGCIVGLPLAAGVAGVTGAFHIRSHTT